MATNLYVFNLVFLALNLLCALILFVHGYRFLTITKYPVSYTHLDVYKRQTQYTRLKTYRFVAILMDPFYY